MLQGARGTSDKFQEGNSNSSCPIRHLQVSIPIPPNMLLYPLDRRLHLYHRQASSQPSPPAMGDKVAATADSLLDKSRPLNPPITHINNPLRSSNQRIVGMALRNKRLPTAPRPRSEIPLRHLRKQLGQPEAMRRIPKCWHK